MLTVSHVFAKLEMCVHLDPNSFIRGLDLHIVFCYLILLLSLLHDFKAI